MKKTLFIFLIMITFPSLTYSQDSLFLKDGSILSGSVLNIGNGKVYFENADTGDRKRHKNVEKVIDDTNGIKIEYQKRKINGITKYFSGEIIQGKASFYITYKYVPGGGDIKMGGYTAFYFIYKEGDKKAFKVLPNSLATPFSKRMSKYFSDCTLLSTKIKNKTFNFGETSKIVEFYNSDCKG